MELELAAAAAVAADAGCTGGGQPEVVIMSLRAGQLAKVNKGHGQSPPPLSPAVSPPAVLCLLFLAPLLAPSALLSIS